MKTALKNLKKKAACNPLTNKFARRFKQSKIQHLISATLKRGVNMKCGFMTARMRILDVFLVATPPEFPEAVKIKCSFQRKGLTTKLTPIAVRAVPIRMKRVIGSLNSVQASTAVVGGTR
jgi:hypothetical protein